MLGDLPSGTLLLHCSVMCIHLSVSSSKAAFQISFLSLTMEMEEEGTINKAPHNGGKKWPTRHPIRRREQKRRIS